jgi:hypothetical protein
MDFTIDHLQDVSETCQLCKWLNLVILTNYDAVHSMKVALYLMQLFFLFVNDGRADKVVLGLTGKQIRQIGC